MVNDLSTVANPRKPIDPRPLDNARRAKGWTIQRLANVTGLSIASISRILSGKQAGVQSVKETADALGVPMTELVVEADTEQERVA